MAAVARPAGGGSVGAIGIRAVAGRECREHLTGFPRIRAVIIVGRLVLEPVAVVSSGSGGGASGGDVVVVLVVGSGAGGGDRWCW